jgi:hypothetical protein
MVTDYWQMGLNFTVVSVNAVNIHIFIAGFLNPSAVCELRNKIRENKRNVKHSLTL